LSNAKTENLPNYWESDDELAISFDDDVHIDVEDFYQESQFDFDDDQWTQSLDIPIDEQDSDEAVLDETHSFVADGGLDDFAEDIVAFEHQNLHIPIDNGFHIDNEETGDEAQEMNQVLAVPLGSRMFEHECLSNDIRTKQQLIRLFYFDNMPAKFNRVLGEQVDVDAAIQFLDHMVEMHMSESEGDDFLALMDRIVSSQTGKVFPMPIRSKTLKLAFLGKADHFFPLEETTIQILPQLFGDSEKSKVHIPPLKKPSILLENALSFLLLKIVPSNLTKESIPLHEIVNGNCERMYEGFCSGDYPIEIQEMMYRDCHLLFHGRKPLLLYVSIFIDGGLMNSTHSRSAIPIVLTILNDSAKSSTLVGFCSKKLHIPDEEFDILLEKKGVTAKSNRKNMKTLALRQA